jgi:signal transduction histidine kinase/CheY-like chemotaxis protein/HPt (histidine-containing phosphotransfer) domain-containing protein
VQGIAAKYFIFILVTLLNCNKVHYPMRTLMLFLLCFAGIAGYAQAPDLHVRSYPGRYNYIRSLEKYLEGKPTRQIIDTLRILEVKARDVVDIELAGELKLLEDMTRFRARNGRNDTVENDFKDVWAMAVNNKLPCLEADALQKLGDYYAIDIHLQSAAIEKYIMAYHVYTNLSDSQFPPKKSYLYELGSFCYRLEDYDNALKFLEEAQSPPGSVPKGLYCPLNNTIGMCFRNMKKYDSAIYYFKQTYARALSDHNKPYEGIAEGNIGISYFLQGEYDEAIPLLKKDIQYSVETGQLKNAMGTMTILSTIYNDRHDYKNAEQLLKSALGFGRGTGWATFPMLAAVYKQLYVVYAAKNDYKAAFAYADSALKANDSQAALNNTLALAKAHDKIEYAQHKMEQDKLQDQIRLAQYELSSKRKMNFALGLSSFLFLALGVIVYVKNKHIAREKKNSDIQRQRAENSERFKQQFLANMSHEIRTPMNAVIGMTDIILEKNPRPDQLNFLKAISKSSDVLLHIINDILDLSKIEAGKMELEAIDFSLAETVKQVISTLSYRAEEKGLQITSMIDRDVPDIVVGDPYRLNQILVNLGGNAIKFTERGGVEIAIKKIKAEPGKVIIQCAVADTGKGIPAEKLKTLFSDFSQVSSSDTRRYGGTGLGLSISKQLVELQGGNIAVDSKPGVGTVFSFNLGYPVGSYERLQERIARETQVDGSILNGLRILIADDNEYNRMVIKETLNLKADVHTDIVENGQEVLTMMQQNDYDVVLMDVQMPVMNGMEATKYIREKMPPPKNQIPIIAFTASILRADIEKFMDCGMNSYLPKPFRAWQLFHTVAEVTGRKAGEPAAIEEQRPIEKITLVTNVSGSVTDQTYLVKFCEGNEERRAKYIHMYLDAVPAFKTHIREAIAAKDFDTIGLRIHAFKPNWTMMGMQTAAELGSKIERLCGSRDETVYHSIEQLLEQTDRSVAELTA